MVKGIKNTDKTETRRQKDHTAGRGSWEGALRIQMKQTKKAAASPHLLQQTNQAQEQETTGEEREKTHKLDEVTLRFKSPRVCEVLI